MILIALANMHNVDSLLLGLLDFFPCFFLFKFEESDTVRKEFDIVLCPLLGRALLCKRIADLTLLEFAHILVSILSVVHLL